MPAKRPAAPARLRGAPGRVAGIVPLPVEGGNVQVEVAGLEAASASVRPVGPPGASDRAWLRINLPPVTPPGEYAGTVQVGGSATEVVLEVEPRVRLRLFPRRQLLRGGPGERVGVSVLVANHGNTPVEIRKLSAVGLFDVEGAERAVGRTFRAGAEGEQLLARLAEELAGGYGGLARLTVDSRSAAVRPGEAIELALTMHLPDELQPGRTYEGVWALEGVNYVIRIEVPGKRSNQREVA